MKLFICANTSDERHIETAKTCIYTLVERCRAEIAMPEEDSRAIFGVADAAGIPENCDYAVAIGGDGTVLRAAQYAVNMDIPLVGINNGRLGYLCAAELSDVEAFGEDAFTKMKRSSRSLLSFRLKNEDKEHFVLNDVVVTKYNMGLSVQMQASYRGETLAEWRCDGVIISTPTGSTAYNFSAGGPKLLSDLPCFVITPICPHNVNTRSIVVNYDAPITVTITEKENRRGYVFADGLECGEISESLAVTRYHKNLILLTR